jgi:hypothetical protein
VIDSLRAPLYASVIFVLVYDEPPLEVRSPFPDSLDERYKECQPVDD